MDEYPVTFNSALFTDYPDTVKDTVEYLAANAVLNAPPRPDFYSIGQTRPPFEDQNRIWAELPAFAYVPGTINTPLSFQLPSVTGATSYVFSSLPTGLTCSSSGLITGTPTVSGFFEELLVITTPEQVFNNTVLIYIIAPPSGANPAPQSFTPNYSGDLYAVRTDIFSNTNGSGTFFTSLPGFNNDPLFFRKFDAPDSSGNFYLYDNNTIKKYSSAGALIGVFATGTSPDAMFTTLPSNLAIDSSNNIYGFIGTATGVLPHSVVKITPAGVISVLAGPGGVTKNGYADGTGSAARFDNPQGSCLDSAGNLFIADTTNNRIRKVTPAGVVTTFAGSGVAGNTDGTGVAAQFNSPRAICCDSSDNLYVFDSASGRIRKITSSAVVTTFFSTGSTSIYSLTVDSSGSIFYPTGNRIDKITSAGVLSIFAGSGTAGSANGTGAAATFRSPRGIVIDSSDNLYVTDYLNYTIRKITSSAVVTTLAGNPGTPGSTDGTAGAATFNLNTAIGINISNGDLYVTPNGQNFRKITSGGVVTTPATGGSGQRDGYLNSALYSNSIVGLSVTSTGLIYISDTNNHTIRVMDIAGNSVTTLAGSPGSTLGFADGTGSAARFDTPIGLTVDSSGNVYVVEQANNTIRKITPAGVVTTLAGLARASGSANGTGSAARFNNPTGIVVNSVGDIFVYDRSNYVIRKVTQAGVVTTVAGTVGTPRSGTTGTPTFDGISFSALFGLTRSSRMRLDDLDDIILEEKYFNSTMYRRLSKSFSPWRDITSSTLFDWFVNAANSFQVITAPSSSLESFYFVSSSTAYLSAFPSLPAVISYSASGLPAGVSINSSTGLLTGTPTTAGVYNAVITANQTYGTLTKGMTIDVLDAAPTYDISAPNLRKYSQGKWLEISALNRGDIILVPSSFAIEFPWGQSQATYDMSFWGEANVTVPTLPTPPAGFKYKYYIGKQIGSEGLPVIV